MLYYPPSDFEFRSMGHGHSADFSDRFCDCFLCDVKLYLFLIFYFLILFVLSSVDLNSQTQEEGGFLWMKMTM